MPQAQESLLARSRDSLSHGLPGVVLGGSTNDGNAGIIACGAHYNSLGLPLH